MKKYIIGILVVLLVIFCSGCIDLGGNNEDDNITEVQSISKGGVSIQYPGDWVVSQSSSNYSVLALSQSDSIDMSKVGQVTVNIEKRPIEGDFNNFVNSTYDAIEEQEEFTLISSGAVIVNDLEGLQYIYQSNDGNVTKEHSALWFNHNGEAYVILCSAPVGQYAQNQGAFDFIVENFKFIA